MGAPFAALLQSMQRTVREHLTLKVSTSDQHLHLQTDALQAYGCVEVAQEKVSSVKERPRFNIC